MIAVSSWTSVGASSHCQLPGSSACSIHSSAMAVEPVVGDVSGRARYVASEVNSASIPARSLLRQAAR